MPSFIIIALLLLTAAFSMGCQTAASTAANKTNSSIVHTPVNANTNPVEPKPEAPQTDVASLGSLATPTDSYKTAYELRKKKDVAGLKKVMHKDALEFLTLIGEDQKKSLDDMLKEMAEKPQADKAEVRKEKIKGNWAELEYLTETGEWKTMDFEKVDGKWLLTLPKAENADEPEL